MSVREPRIDDTENIFDTYVDNDETQQRGHFELETRNKYYTYRWSWIKRLKLGLMETVGVDQRGRTGLIIMETSSGDRPDVIIHVDGDEILVDQRQFDIFVEGVLKMQESIRHKEAMWKEQWAKEYEERFGQPYEKEKHERTSST